MEMNRKYSAALESLNQAIVQYNWYSPALVEKARVRLRSVFIETNLWKVTRYNGRLGSSFGDN